MLRYRQGSFIKTYSDEDEVESYKERKIYIIIKGEDMSKKLKKKKEIKEESSTSWYSVVWCI